MSMKMEKGKEKKVHGEVRYINCHVENAYKVKNPRLTRNTREIGHNNSSGNYNGVLRGRKFVCECTCMCEREPWLKAMEFQNLLNKVG